MSPAPPLSTANASKATDCRRAPRAGPSRPHRCPLAVGMPIHLMLASSNWNKPPVPPNSPVGEPVTDPGPQRRAGELSLESFLFWF